MLSLAHVPAEELKAQEQWAVAPAMSTKRSGAAGEARSGWEGWLSAERVRGGGGNFRQAFPPG